MSAAIPPGGGHGQTIDVFLVAKIANVLCQWRTSAACRVVLQLIGAHSAGRCLATRELSGRFLGGLANKNRPLNSHTERVPLLRPLLPETAAKGKEAAINH